MMINNDKIAKINKLCCIIHTAAAFIIFFRLLKEKVEELLAGYIQGAIQTSLKQIFGEIGGLTEIKILGLLEESGDFYVKTPKADLKKVRAALTLIAKFQGIPCHFRVNQVCPILVQALE